MYQDDIAKNLKELRKKAGLTQDELADKAKVNRSSLSSWETGAVRKETGKRILPDTDEMLRLCHVFNVDLAFLTGESKIPNEKRAFIAETTGLSDENIERLTKLKKNMNDIDLHNINVLLGNEFGLMFINEIVTFLEMDFFEDEQQIVFNDAGDETYINSDHLETVYLLDLIYLLKKWKEGIKHGSKKKR